MSLMRNISEKIPYVYAFEPQAAKVVWTGVQFSFPGATGSWLHPTHAKKRRGSLGIGME